MLLVHHENRYTAIFAILIDQAIDQTTGRHRVKCWQTGAVAVPTVLRPRKTLHVIRQQQRYRQRASGMRILPARQIPAQNRWTTGQALCQPCVGFRVRVGLSQQHIQTERLQASALRPKQHIHHLGQRIALPWPSPQFGQTALIHIQNHHIAMHMGRCLPLSAPILPATLNPRDGLKPPEMKCMAHEQYQQGSHQQASPAGLEQVP